MITFQPLLEPTVIIDWLHTDAKPINVSYGTSPPATIIPSAIFHVEHVVYDWETTEW